MYLFYLRFSDPEKQHIKCKIEKGDILNYEKDRLYHRFQYTANALYRRFSEVYFRHLEFDIFGKEYFSEYEPEEYWSLIDSELSLKKFQLETKEGIALFIDSFQKPWCESGVIEYVYPYNNIQYEKEVIVYDFISVGIFGNGKNKEEAKLKYNENLEKIMSYYKEQIDRLEKSSLGCYRKT